MHREHGHVASKSYVRTVLADGLVMRGYPVVVRGTELGPDDTSQTRWS